MKQSLEPDDWPEHLQLVFREVGRAMTARRLSPEVLSEVRNGLGTIVPDHEVVVEHLSGEAAGARGNHYRIAIDGPRVAGTWTFRSGELELLARASMARSAQTP
jgi:hypothetical protein